MRYVSPLALLLAAGCGTGAAPRAAPVGPGAPRIAIRVEIDTKGVPLGAYQLSIVYDRAEAKIVEVRPTTGSDFVGKPNFHDATFATGHTRVTGYSTRQGMPAEPYRLLTVTFESLDGPRRSPVNVNVERLYDTSRPPREITRFDVAKSRDTLDFSQPDE
jgi:hypothetical protein